MVCCLGLLLSLAFGAATPGEAGLPVASAQTPSPTFAPLPSSSATARASASVTASESVSASVNISSAPEVSASASTSATVSASIAATTCTARPSKASRRACKGCRCKKPAAPTSLAAGGGGPERSARGDGWRFRASGSDPARFPAGKHLRGSAPAPLGPAPSAPDGPSRPKAGGSADAPAPVLRQPPPQGRFSGGVDAALPRDREGERERTPATPANHPPASDLPEHTDEGQSAASSPEPAEASPAPPLATRQKSPASSQIIDLLALLTSGGVLLFGGIVGASLLAAAATAAIRTPTGSHHRR
jgi:hypothetical protein